MVAGLTPAIENEPTDLSSLSLAITEHAPLPMVTVEGAEHMVRYVNPAFCRLISRNEDELIGKSFAEMMPEWDGCLALLDRVYLTGEPESQTDPDSTAPHPLLWSYTVWPVLDAGEGLVGIMLQVTETTKFHQRSAEMSEALLLGSVRQHELTAMADKLNAQLVAEITERKRAEHELIAAKDEISKHARQLEETVVERTAKLRETIGELEAFSYSVSHDMRAPLRAMRGFARILLETHSAQLDAEGIKHLEKIHAAAGRMDSLIEEVLTYTRVLRAEVKLEPVDLDVLVRQVIGTYPQLQTDEVEIQIEGKLPKVLGGEASLGQCISNLLANAVKFVPPGTKPRVKIRAEAIAADIRLWVEDNGIGIAPQDQVRIFKMFERVGSATTYEGTGMGLTIVRKAMERMGGQMGLESEAGQGSKFWIQLKAAKQ